MTKRVLGFTGGTASGSNPDATGSEEEKAQTLTAVSEVVDTLSRMNHESAVEFYEAEIRDYCFMMGCKNSQSIAVARVEQLLDEEDAKRILEKMDDLSGQEGDEDSEESTETEARGESGKGESDESDSDDNSEGDSEEDNSEESSKGDDGESEAEEGDSESSEGDNEPDEGEGDSDDGDSDDGSEESEGGDSDDGEDADSKSDEGDSEAEEREKGEESEGKESEVESENPFEDEFSGEAEEDEEDEDWIIPSEFDEAEKLLKAGLNVYLVGPAGCGKTTLAELVAKKWGVNFGALSLSKATFESAFTYSNLPSDGMKFVAQPSELARLSQSPGVFLFDEIENADANTLTSINMLIAQRVINVPFRNADTLCKEEQEKEAKKYKCANWEEFHGRYSRTDMWDRYNKSLARVKLHKDFKIIAAGNTFGEGGSDIYVREQLDAATLDRFRAGTITMDYSRELEQRIIKPDLLMAGWLLRETVKKLDSARFVSTRFMKDCDKADYKPSDMIEKFVLPMADVEREQFKGMFNKVSSDEATIKRLMEGE